jgi:hypothetical protein
MIKVEVILCKCDCDFNVGYAQAQGSTVFADLQLAFEVLECARKAYEDVTEGRTPEQLEKLADTYM